MNITHAVILGLVEGITEYLPVSSTGHLIMASSLLKLNNPANKAAIDAFEIVIQGGAILAVVGLYFPRFLQMLRGLLGKDPAGFRLFLNICIAFLPAAIVGLLLKKLINQYLFFAGPVVFATMVGGVYMILVEAWRGGRIARTTYYKAGKEIDDMSVLDALRVGCFQILALWPGTSRSMMTITGGYFGKLRPQAAAEFSFLLGVPTLLAATLKALYDNYKDHKLNHEPMFYETLGVMPVVVGLVVAAVSAAIAVKWLVGVLNKQGLIPFGIYRLLLGVLMIGLILGGILTITKP